MGEHISPGTYSTTAGNSCYWERLKGLTGDLNATLANGLGSGKIRSAASDWDDKMIKIAKKIALSLIRLFINLRWFTFSNYVIKIYV